MQNKIKRSITMGINLISTLSGFLSLTQAGGSIKVWLVAFIADTPSNRNHPLPFSIAVHSRGCAPLCFTVGDACPSHRHQGSWLSP